MSGYRVIDVPVRGGAMRTAPWGPDDPGAPAVLAVHGVTSSHLAWAKLAEVMPEVRIVAPDLRGRGRSNSLPGPFGMGAHAEDMAAVATALGVESGVVVGHSMGAFVALVLAHRRPDLVRSLVLVDGGLPLQVPANLKNEEVVAAVLGPAAERLNQSFGSREDYRRFWRQHPAFSGNFTSIVEAYVDYDLTGNAPHLRPATAYAAMAEDTADLHSGDALPSALAALAVPTVLLRSPSGLLNEPGGLYASDYVDEWATLKPQFTAVHVPLTNHYTILMDTPGVLTVAAAVRAASVSGSVGSRQC